MPPGRPSILEVVRERCRQTRLVRAATYRWLCRNPSIKSKRTSNPSYHSQLTPRLRQLSASVARQDRPTLTVPFKPSQLLILPIKTVQSLPAKTCLTKRASMMMSRSKRSKIGKEVIHRARMNSKNLQNIVRKIDLTRAIPTSALTVMVSTAPLASQQFLPLSGHFGMKTRSQRLSNTIKVCKGKPKKERKPNTIAFTATRRNRNEMISSI
jgi:hypothetical protein